MAFCTNCGRKNEDGAAFCAGCGIALTIPVSTTGQFTQDPGFQPPREQPTNGYAPPPPQAIDSPQLDRNGNPIPPGYARKSALVAGLLQLFLGTLGVGRFYLGFVGTGVCQILFGWLTLYIWPLVDGIRILLGHVPYDANGVPLEK